jgi:hypothetical protein
VQADVQGALMSWAKLLNEKFPGFSYKLLTVDRETVAFQTTATDIDIKKV